MFHLASQQLYWSGFPWCSGVSKQLEGKKPTALWITELRHSIVGSHCRGQSSTWLGQELLLSVVVQLIWGPHLSPSSGPSELWQPSPICTVAKQSRPDTLPKDSRSPPVPGPPALSLEAFWDSALSQVHLSAHQLSLTSLPRWCGVGGVGRSSLTTLLFPVPPGSHGDGGQGHARVTQP